MFIGEMGCWLVVLGYWVYQRYLARSSSAPSASHLYQRLPTENTSEVVDDDEDTNNEPTSRPFSSHSHTSSSPSPALKPLLSNTTEARPPLTGWSTFLLAIPSSCDIAGTTLMNVGLLFVAASIYQMTRGALVLFVGLFSVLFLKRQLHAYHWFSLFIVVLGVAVVGLAGALFPGGDKNSPASAAGGSKTDMPLLLAARDLATQALAPEVLRTITGILLIAIAQIFTATQFCVEEWILEHYALEPLRVVGWEGVFGFSATILAQTILHFSVGVTERGQHGYFDARSGYGQVLSNRIIAVTSVLIMVSIGGFNFFGLSVTRSISATSRSIIDTCRTLFIWIVSLGLGWESFKWLQVVGFALLVYGTFLFNDMVRPPIKALLPRGGDEVRRRRGSLLQEEPIEHM
jgi:drug/metabolite transporter (DMT)-like permease